MTDVLDVKGIVPAGPGQQVVGKTGAITTKLPAGQTLVKDASGLPIAVMPTNMVARVAAASPTPPTTARPASLRAGNTNGLADQSFFRALLYGETSRRKTSTAASFAGPEFTRIILTRSEDQLLPLDGAGYQYVHCADGAALNYALRNPEALWPDWAAMADPLRQRTIMVDDITKGVNLLVEANSARDARMAYRDAQQDLDKAIQSLGRKPYNQILVALAKVKENSITNEEQIGPDLPPSMLNYVLAEFTAVLYVKDGVASAPWKMLTDRDTFAYEDTDPATGKTRSYRRTVFAKHKSSLSRASKGPNPNAIQLAEPLDLKAFWAKCRQGGK